MNLEDFGVVEMSEVEMSEVNGGQSANDMGYWAGFYFRESLAWAPRGIDGSIGDAALNLGNALASAFGR